MLVCRLKGVDVSFFNVDLMERVCHLSNKIYREMLCTTGHETMTIITIRGLDYVQFKAVSRTPQCRIVLSWDLLDWILVERRIPCLFTNFITTPELSGTLYISPDIYHTQITEYSLQTIYEPYPLHLPNWSFREHLSGALPTEHIFFLLRSIHSECLIMPSEYSAELMLESIIKWLQGLGSEQPSDLHDRFEGELLRCKSVGITEDCVSMRSVTPQTVGERSRLFYLLSYLIFVSFYLVKITSYLFFGIQMN